MDECLPLSMLKLAPPETSTGGNQLLLLQTRAAQGSQLMHRHSGACQGVVLALQWHPPLQDSWDWACRILSIAHARCVNLTPWYPKAPGAVCPRRGHRCLYGSSWQIC